jgi:hypothetical protein
MNLPSSGGLQKTGQTAPERFWLEEDMMDYYEKHNAEARLRYEHDVKRDPVIQRWLGEVAIRASKPETTVTFLDPFPYDEIRF